MFLRLSKFRNTASVAKLNRAIIARILVAACDLPLDHNTYKYSPSNSMGRDVEPQDYSKLTKEGADEVLLPQHLA